MDNPLKIYSEFLSDRTVNALARHDINTVRELVNLPEKEIGKIRGIGEKGLTEIMTLFNNLDSITNVADSEHFSFLEDQPIDSTKTTDELHEWLYSGAIKERTANIIVEKFGLITGKPKTAAKIAEELGLTRSRLGQILENGLGKLKPAIIHGKINPDIHQTLKKCANRNTNLNDISGLSDCYNNPAIAKLFAKITGEYEIFASNYLKSEWLVTNSQDFNKQIDSALDWLKCQIGFVPIRELASKSGVRVDILKDLASTKVKDDYIALVNGYRKNGVNYTALILQTLRNAVKPLTLKELSEKTGLDHNTIRSYTYRIPGVVSVGNSTWGLEEYGYTNKDSETLIIEYLKEWGTPRHINEITKYVLHYRVVNPSAISSVIYAKPEVFTRIGDGYVALAEWGFESDARKKINFEVKARDAVLSVLKDSERAMSNRDILEAVIAKFGNKATSNTVTIASATTDLEKEGLIECLGTRTHYYKIKQ